MMAFKNVEDLFQKVRLQYKFPHFLKEEQKEALELLLEKENVCLVLPTGFGKSLVYWLLPCLLDLVRSKISTPCFVSISDPLL